MWDTEVEAKRDGVTGCAGWGERQVRPGGEQGQAAAPGRRVRFWPCPTGSHRSLQAGVDVIRLAFCKSHPRCIIEVRWGQRRIWRDTLTPFSGGEGFESNRGAEISSKFPTLAIRWAKMPCVEKGRVLWLGGKTVHLTRAS